MNSAAILSPPHREPPYAELFSRGAQTTAASEPQLGHPLRLAQQLLNSGYTHALFRSDDSSMARSFTNQLLFRLGRSNPVRTLTGAELTAERIDELENWINALPQPEENELLTTLTPPRRPQLVITEAETIDGSSYQKLHQQLLSSGRCQLVLAGDISLKRLLKRSGLTPADSDRHLEIDLLLPPMPEEWLTSKLRAFRSQTRRINALKSRNRSNRWMLPCAILPMTLWGIAKLIDFSATPQLEPLTEPFLTSTRGLVTRTLPTFDRPLPLRPVEALEVSVPQPVAPGIEQTEERESTVQLAAVKPPEPQFKTGLQTGAVVTPKTITTVAAAKPETGPETGVVALIATPEPELQPEKAESGIVTAKPGDWMSLQPQQNFTLQLAVTRTRSAAEKLQGTLGAIPSAIYPKTVRGEAWFCLIAGSASNEQALARIKQQLPAAVRQNKPWQRLFADVQKERTHP